MRRIATAALVSSVACADVGARVPAPAPIPPFDDDASYANVPPYGSPEPGNSAGAAPETGFAAGPDEATIPGRDDDSGADAPADVPSAEGPPVDLCPDPLHPGDLAIDELMIESVAGAGDHGEWLEVQSTRDCTLDLRGLQGTCPYGAKVASFEIGSHLWLAPRAAFVVADSVDAVLNHSLPGVVVAWAGGPGDVLRNKGTTITLAANGAVIDTVTYPSLPLAVGASLAFPADCDPARRSDWSAWQTSTSSWFTGFEGTPNRPNADVSCP